MIVWWWKKTKLMLPETIIFSFHRKAIDFPFKMHQNTLLLSFYLYIYLSVVCIYFSKREFYSYNSVEKFRTCGRGFTRETPPFAFTRDTHPIS